MTEVERRRGLIPTGMPFVFITDIQISEPGVRGEAWLTDLREERFDYIRRDFPLDGGKVPGMILGEAMAEIFGSVAFSEGRVDPEDEGLLARLDNIRFLKEVYDSDSVLIKVEIIRGRQKYKSGRAEAFRGEEMVAYSNLEVVAKRTLGRS